MMHQLGAIGCAIVSCLQFASVTGQSDYQQIQSNTSEQKYRKFYGHYMSDMNRLSTAFWENYNTKDPDHPINNGVLPVVAQMWLKIGQLVGVDEKRETLSLAGVLYIEWEDNNISKIGRSRCGTDVIKKVPASAVWIPNVYQMTDPEFPDLLQMKRDKLNVRITWNYDEERNSSNKLFIYDIFSAKCEMQNGIKAFPFDQHVCDFLWMSDEYLFSLILKINYEKNDPDRLESFAAYTGGTWFENSGWTIESIHLEEINFNYRTSTLFRITVSRKYGFYIQTIIIPTLIVAVLQLATLFVRHSFERCQLLLTILLAFWIIQSVVTGIVPQVSNSVLLKCIAAVSVLDAVFIVESICVLFYFDWSLASVDAKKKHLLVIDSTLFFFGCCFSLLIPVFFYQF